MKKYFVDNECVHNIGATFKKIIKSYSPYRTEHKRAASKHKIPLSFKEDKWVLLMFTKALFSCTNRNRQGAPTSHQNYYTKPTKEYLLGPTKKEGL